MEGAEEEEEEEEKGEKPVQAAGRGTFLVKHRKTPAILARFGSARSFRTPSFAHLPLRSSFIKYNIAGVIRSSGESEISRSTHTN